MSTVLQSFSQIANVWNDLSLDDTTIGVSDTERFLAYYPGKTFSLGIHAGDVIKPGSITHKALTTGKRQSGYVPKEVFGVPTIAIGLPIFEDGRVAGCISTATTLEKQESLLLAAEHLSSAMEQLSATSEQLSASAHEVEQLSSQVQIEADVLKHKVAQISLISELVRDISERTHILGINARIEATHAGEYGKAFGVAATEVQRLASETANSTKEIGQLLTEIQQNFLTFVLRLGSISHVTQEQLAGIQTIAQMTTHLAQEAEKLHLLAHYGDDGLKI